MEYLARQLMKGVGVLREFHAGMPRKRQACTEPQRRIPPDRYLREQNRQPAGGGSPEDLLSGKQYSPYYFDKRRIEGRLASLDPDSHIHAGDPDVMPAEISHGQHGRPQLGRVLGTVAAAETLPRHHDPP